MCVYFSLCIGECCRIGCVPWADSTPNSCQASCYCQTSSMCKDLTHVIIYTNACVARLVRRHVRKHCSRHNGSAAEGYQRPPNQTSKPNKQNKTMLVKKLTN